MKNENNPQISYSGILIKFIEPILTGTEDEDEYLLKAKAGQMAWNYCISDDNKLPLNSVMKAIMKNLTTHSAEAKETLNMLVLRKTMLFPNHQQFIFNVEIKTKPDGSKTLLVESTPADNIRK